MSLRLSLLLSSSSPCIPKSSSQWPGVGVDSVVESGAGTTPLSVAADVPLIAEALFRLPPWRPWLCLVYRRSFLSLRLAPLFCSTPRLGFFLLGLKSGPFLSSKSFPAPSTAYTVTSSSSPLLFFRAIRFSKKRSCCALSPVLSFPGGMRMFHSSRIGFNESFCTPVGFKVFSVVRIREELAPRISTPPGRWRRAGSWVVFSPSQSVKIASVPITSAH